MGEGAVFVDRRGKGSPSFKHLTLKDGAPFEGEDFPLVTHEMNFARQLADRVHFFVDGRILESGTPEQVFDAPNHSRLADFNEAWRGAGGRS